jgi:glycosyltransferase involved in cell wall biosynthesis
MSARSIRAVMVTPSAFGGHARYTWELMTALRAAAPPSDLDLTLLTSVDLAPEFRAEHYAIADVLPPLRRTFANKLEWAASRSLHYARREEAVLRWVRGQAPIDIVHYQEPPFAPALHFRRVRAAGPHPVATVHNVRPHSYPIPALRWVNDVSAHLGWRQCAALFVHSPGLRDQLASELGRRAPPVVPIPHGVWTGHRVASSPPRGEGYLLLFGVMRRNKGVHLMLDSLRHLPGKRLVLAGAIPEPSLAREIRHRIDSERLPVELLDRFVPEAEIAPIFAGASLAVLPYVDFVAQSGVLHMAISYGIPVVVTDVGALGEQVRRERIGTVAAAAEPSALASAVVSALEPAVYEAASRHCVTLARTLSWSAAAQLTLEEYRRICSCRSPR